MSHYLAGAGRSPVRTRWLKRFDAAHWTLNFPRPMMASATTPNPGPNPTPNPGPNPDPGQAGGAGALRIDLEFLKADDLCGLIWESEDSADHPLLRYETARDYRGTVLSFRWRSEGAVRALDQLNGPVLTIEGRDESGAARAWYVRLWNYAAGTPNDAAVTLDFDALEGGFLLPGEADPVWAGDVDRMFISMVPEGFTGADEALPETQNATVRIEDMSAEGASSVLAQGDAEVPPHPLRMATGYDDHYNLTPERVMRNMRALGYGAWLNVYVGMSHYMRLLPAGSDKFEVAASGDPLCAPCRSWFGDLLARCAAVGIQTVLSLSYELFDAHAPEDWKQRAADGSPALTGWVPPSTLLSPASENGMSWLRSVGAAFAGMAAAHGPVWMQIGEPWWWTGFGANQVPAFYDQAARDAYLAESGTAAPEMATLPQVLNAAEQDFTAWLGAKLGTSTLALRDAMTAAAPGAKVALLFYAPQVLRTDAAWLADVNMPNAWAAPAFDVLQLEDYDFVIQGDRGASRRAAARIETELGYGPGVRDYFSGFVPSAAEAELWTLIAEAAEGALGEVRETFVWALPQVMRDGFTFFRSEDEDVDAFHDVSFPLALSAGAGGGPEFRTDVADTLSGHEQRAVMWTQGRLSFDAGLGVRSEADLVTAQRFFRARRGRAHAFRFRDPLDHASGEDGASLSPFDQYLGTGDGVRTDFALVKRYGEGGDAEVRRVTRPETGTVRVAVGGAEVAGGWSLESGGTVRFDAPPADGQQVEAGYAFDVPVRFAEDRLDVSLGAWRSGEVPAIPLVEVRED